MQEALGFDSPSRPFFDFRFRSFCFILVFGLVYPLVSIAIQPMEVFLDGWMSIFFSFGIAIHPLF